MTKPATTLPAFIRSACSQRERLVRAGKSKLKAAEAYKAIKALKLWLDFHGHKGEQVVRDWAKREQHTIEMILPPSWTDKFKILIEDE